MAQLKKNKRNKNRRKVRRNSNAFGRKALYLGAATLAGIVIWCLISDKFGSNQPTTEQPQKKDGTKDQQVDADGTNVSRISLVRQHYTELPLEQRPRIFHWFGGVAEAVEKARLETGDASNIRMKDYAGAQACKDCHEENYKKWSTHPHRWMNAWATEENIRGDFSDRSIHYMGGVGSFYRENGKPRMKLERNGIRRVYSITRTIGSRFFQYYAGRLIEGPDSPRHEVRRSDHLLPFGYWFEQQEWVPTVNIEEEMPDEKRVDPFAGPSIFQYDRYCSECHTTRPTGDLLLLVAMMRRFDAYSPRIAHFSAEEYLNEEHPKMVKPLAGHARLSRKQMYETISKVRDLPAMDHAVNLGISCEGCHNGCASHVKDEKQSPMFFPVSPHIHLENTEDQTVLGRNSVNSNWVCSRCHAGNRVRYAAGISTWNSTEFSDASRGSCYDPSTAHQHGKQHLTCVHCHDPHKAIGPKWSLSADQDDASCISCHEQLKDPTVRAKHTHHIPGSDGDRCMNCHMPRINEGLQDVVRTHTIFNPTESRMIEANQPNACNICHVKEPIDWTLRHLEEWYGVVSYSKELIAKNYPDRDKPVALGWLKSSHHGTRLIGADALIRAKSHWALDEILKILDDPYLVNRQFTSRGLSNMLGIDLRKLGYRFYMFRKERKQPLQRLRKEIFGPSGNRSQQIQ